VGKRFGQAEMAATFDRMEFVRALRGKPGLSDETLEALADALHKQQDAADLVTRKDLAAVVTELNLWTAGIAAVLAAFLSVIKFFG
jgi:pseudouridine-5'-phosphate glycosidase